MPSIFDGTDEIINNALELNKGESWEQKTTCLKLAGKNIPNNFKPELVSELFERIRNDWNGQINQSNENWRKEQQTYICTTNDKPEELLERAIAILAENDDLPKCEWYNQIPVASGLINQHSDGRSAIDLVHRTGNSVELIELKWESNTPLYALFEILRYAMVLLFSRLYAEKLGYLDSQRDMPLIKSPVSKIDLVVLAPKPYYTDYPKHRYNGYDFKEYAKVILDGLKQLRNDYPNLPQEYGIRFLQFPSWFEHPFKNGAEVKEMHPDKRKILLEAMENHETLWEVKT